MTREEYVIENMASVGYQTMHDSRWDNLPENSIERALWSQVASSMLNELRRVWEEAKLRE